MKTVRIAAWGVWQPGRPDTYQGVLHCYVAVLKTPLLMVHPSRRPQRVLHHRAWSLPAAGAAGAVHPVWARGGHVTDTWLLLYFVKHILLVCVFTEETPFGWLKKTSCHQPSKDRFRAKTQRFPTSCRSRGRSTRCLCNSPKKNGVTGWYKSRRRRHGSSGIRRRPPVQPGGQVRAGWVRGAL